MADRDPPSDKPQDDELPTYADVEAEEPQAAARWNRWRGWIEKRRVYRQSFLALSADASLIPRAAERYAEDPSQAVRPTGWGPSVRVSTSTSNPSPFHSNGSPSPREKIPSKMSRRLLHSRGDSLYHRHRDGSTLSSISHHQITFHPNHLYLKENLANHRDSTFISSDRGSCLMRMDESIACCPYCQTGFCLSEVQMV